MTLVTPVTRAAPSSPSGRKLICLLIHILIITPMSPRLTQGPLGPILRSRSGSKRQNWSKSGSNNAQNVGFHGKLRERIAALVAK